tara:strand:+ start:346 stop:1161 length:816 start_codon:yes stop_codon:yes gene_type:complete
VKLTKGKIKKIFFGFFILLLTFSSVLEINENKSKIRNRLKKTKVVGGQYSYEVPKDLENETNRKFALDWARKINEGGYILYFRHAERDKWKDVQMYDALESDLHDNGPNQTRFGENTYFSQAVCLNKRGKIQAKGMKEVIEYSKLPVGYIVTSPSCRARQTASFVFGGYDKIDRILVHKGPYTENMKKRNEKLKTFFLSLPLDNDKNTIVSAHNGVIDNSLFSNVISRRDGGPKLKLEEAGFFIISKKDGELYLEYEFDSFAHYSKNFFPR